MLYQLSYWPSVRRGTIYCALHLFRFAVQSVLPATRTKLVKLEPIRVVAAILFRGVIAFLAITTLKGDHRSDIFLLRSHSNVPTFLTTSRRLSCRYSIVLTEPAGRYGSFYSSIFVTTPAPTVRPPSRMANFEPCSNATGTMSSTVRFTLSPGITISTPSGKAMFPVTSMVRM